MCFVFLGLVKNDRKFQRRFVIFLIQNQLMIERTNSIGRNEKKRLQKPCLFGTVGEMGKCLSR